MNATDGQEFGALLRRYRLAAGLTQEELAERAGLSVRGISDLERGIHRAARRDTAQLLAEALDLAEPEMAALAAARRPGRAAPLAPSPPRHSLPLPPTPLLGREREVARAVEILRYGSPPARTRLLTLTGPGGVGKTRLALEVAHRLAGEITDGAVLVSLAPLRDAGLVETAIAQALELREDGAGGPHERLVAHLATRSMLLVLDNFEHLLGAGPAVAALLAHCPDVRVLTTSRALLRVRGEQELSVGPLEQPPLGGDGQLPSVEDLLRAPAVALLVERVRSHRPGWSLQAQDAAAVVAICRRLDGLPLAIELAAPRVKLLSPAALLARLDRSLRLLTGGASDLPERQQTLRGAIGASHDLLHPGEQALFRRLAVFAGGCTVEAVEAVCHTAGALETDGLDWLQSLVDKSLLRMEEPTQRGVAGELRVTMLETIREYALEQLVGAGEEGELRRGHAAYYLALAEEAEPRLAGPEQMAWLARLETEHDNLRAALTWAHVHDPALGLRLGGALGQFWASRGYLGEGRRRLEDLMAADAARGCIAAPAARARALAAAGRLTWRQNDLARAEALLEESLALYRHGGDRRGEVSVLLQLGVVADRRCDWARAGALFEEALSLARTLDDVHGLTAALNNLGNIARHRADYGRAAALYEENLAITRAAGNWTSVAIGLTNLALVALARGEPARAVALGKESLGLHDRLGTRTYGLAALHVLSDATGALGDLDGAQDYTRERLRLTRELGDERGAAEALAQPGNLLRQQGEVTCARTLLTESVATCRAVGDRWGIATALLHLATLACDERDFDEAQRLAGESLRLFGELDLTLDRAHCLAVLAVAAHGRGAAAVAARLCGTVMAHCTAMGVAAETHQPVRLGGLHAVLRRELGEQTFAVHFASGGALSLEQAAAEALALGDAAATRGLDQ